MNRFLHSDLEQFGESPKEELHSIDRFEMIRQLLKSTPGSIKDHVSEKNTLNLH